MNNQGKVEAYNSFYQQGKDLFASGDIAEARVAFLKAADLANEIALSASSYDVRMDYHSSAKKILEFVKTKCVNKKEVVGESSTENNNKNIKPQSKDGSISFDDVAGLKEVKDEIRFKVLEPLENPELAKRYKIQAGGKILLYGPPGTGKTFIARAIAGEVDAEFYAVNCQDLISKYMGDSSRQLDALFEEAQKNEKAIIFFDEFDSVASKRGDSSDGVDAEMARFVATFLTKVDGFKVSKSCKMLLLIAATNRPWVIDSAMLRGGRFDTQIYVGVPDYDARLFLVEKSFDGLPLDGDVNLEKLAEVLDGYGGGDIMAICDKIKLNTYKRAIKSHQEENISREDCNSVLSNSKSNLNTEELAKFAIYRELGTII